MYAGLDVASAKVPLPSRLGVPHHLMSFLPPRAHVTVRDFKRAASAVIADVAARGKLPVVVGGTLYYVQALLRESLLEDDEEAARAAREGCSGGGGSSAPAGAPAAEPEGAPASLHARLARVDPVMARRLHPADTRKLERALAVFDTTGVPYSELLAKQAARLEGATGPYDARTYWLSVDDRAVHNARLDERVAGMLAEGLPKDIRALRAELAGTATAAPPQRDEPSPLTRSAVAGLIAERSGDAATGGGGGGGGGGGDDDAPGGSFSGLLQAIGYKEFEDYLTLCDAHPGVAAAAAAPPAAAAPSKKRARAPPPTPEEALAAALQRGAARLREVTHGYARKQERWIRNRFEARGVPLVKVDTSTLGGGWAVAVGAPVVADVRAWLAGAPAAQLLPPSRPVGDGSGGAIAAAPEIGRILAWKQVACEPCGGRVINGEDAWAAHVASKGHKRAVARGGQLGNKQ